MGKLGKCPCGCRIDLADGPAPDAVSCPACGRVLKLRLNPNASPSADRVCPSCKKAVPPHAAVCVACGLDFRTGQRVGISGDVYRAQHRPPKVGFFSRPITYFGDFTLTGRHLALMLAAGAILVPLGCVLFSSCPVRVLDVQTVEAFTALDKINPYLFYVPGDGDERIQMGFAPMEKTQIDALGVLNVAGGHGPKKLILVREWPRGDSLLVRLAISQKFLVDHGSADGTDLHMEAAHVQLRADNQTLPGLLLEYEYPAPISAELLTARDFHHFLPPGFEPRIEEKPGPRERELQSLVTYSSGSRAGLSGRVMIWRQPATFPGLPPGGATYLSGTLAAGGEDDPALAAEGKLCYQSPSGMAVNYRYRKTLLTLTWDKNTRCRRGVSSTWETRFVFTSSKWEILVLFPRPKSSIKNAELKVFDWTFKVSLP